MVNAGRILIIPKGTWSNLQNYEMLDLVSLDGVAYLARTASVGQNPSTDTQMNYWQPFGTASEIATISEPGLVMPDGQTITIDATGLIQANLGISDLNNVTITSIANGQILVYDSTAGAWKNANLSVSAGDVNYNNQTSGLTATKTQGAIDEVCSQMQTLTSDLSDISDEVAKTYKTDDAAETTMEDDDYIPFYDSSAQTTKKISKANANFGGGGGSIITIITTEDDLIGKTVTVTDGTNTFSGVFGSDYTAIIENVTATGTLTISSTGTSETASTTLEVTYFGKYSASLAFCTLFGFHVDSTVSDPEDAVSYQVQYNNKNVDNYDYSAGAMDFTNDVWSYGSWSEDDFFMPKPCLVSQDYTDIIYLNPDNYTVDVDGNDVSAKLTGSTDGYNAMVEWGKNGKQIWYKLVPDSDATSYTVYICNKQLDSDFVAWSFYDANNVLGDHFYTSIYNGAVVSSVMRSLSGKTPNNTTAGTTQITYAKANNQNSESYAWYIDTFADRVLINLLLILVTKSLNSDVVGYGNYTSGPSVSNLLTTGTGNNKGMFYGKQSNAVVKVFGMENWFANCWRRMAGLVLNSGSLLYKMTYGTADGSSAAGYIESDSVPSNYLTGNTISTSLNLSYIMKQTAKTDGSLLPSTFGGANATYYSDACWSGEGVKFARVGGYCNNGSACGAFALFLADALSVSSWAIGCGLSLKPLN